MEEVLPKISYTPRYIAPLLITAGWTPMPDNADNKTENDRKIFFKKNILVEIHFEKTYLGTRINELCLVDNNYGFDKLSQRFVMTTSIIEHSLYNCTGIPFEEFMEIATGPVEHIHMLVENYKTEKALEVL